MSLIFGVNLSDRIYLAGDTRVSHLKKDGELSWVEDKVLKIEPVTGRIAVACAGDVVLIKYLLDLLRNNTSLIKDINYLRENIKDWVAKQVGRYLDQGNPYAKACFIFAGVDEKQKKKIDPRKITGMVKELGGIKRSYNPPKYINDAILKGLNANPNKPLSEIEIPVANTRAFAVRTDARNMFLDVQEAMWGEYLVYGPKEFTRERIPAGIFNQLEFETGPITNGGAQSLLTAFIRGVEEKQKLLTVGGSITTFIISEKTGLSVMAGKVFRKKIGSSIPELVSDTKLEKGRIMYRLNDRDKYKELVPISKYTSRKSSLII